MNSAKPKLKILVKGSSHFLRWEIPYFKKFFQLVDESDQETILLVFGPDIIAEAIKVPAKLRVIMLFPGFGKNLLHNLTHRQLFLDLIDNYYDLVFVNPGPLEIAFAECSKKIVVPFTVDPAMVAFRAFRKRIDSLLHASYPWPHKDWERSAKIMSLTGLQYEIFPQRNAAGTVNLSYKTRFKLKCNHLMDRLCVPFQMPINSAEMCGYTSHADTIKKYQKYDAFVHVAAPLPCVDNLDGKYTACLLEAGLTGAIIFWHDTHGLGNNFETFFDIPKEEEKAAEFILEVRKNLDVEKHSRLTREEILDKCNLEKSVGLRSEKMLELFG